MNQNTLTEALLLLLLPNISHKSKPTSTAYMEHSFSLILDLKEQPQQRFIVMEAAKRIAVHPKKLDALM